MASAVAEYLREAKKAGFREVRLIHGKGIGVRRAEVRRLLACRQDIADYGDAPPERGGMGATIVVFRLPRSPPSAASRRARPSR
ncbi:MAG: Smr/MutS family protein [Thermoanaerobaculia bacterium]